MGSKRKAVDAAPPREANAHRGEHDLPLGSRTFLLRPSWEAIDAIERKTERALPELIRMGNAGALPLRIAGIIAAELVRAGADEKDTFTRNVSAERLSELIFEQGVAGAIARLTLCLVDAATGGRTSSGEAKPVAPTMTAEPGATGD